jgi:CheY-like chemotaxis protein
MIETSAPVLNRIHVLVVDGEEHDAELTVAEFGRATMAVEFRVVTSQAELREALATFAPDVVLCDVAERNAGHVDALGIVQTLKLDLPVILVAGAIGERGVAAALRGGAVDYVLKASLVRLPSAVEHAVRESREKRALEDSLRLTEERLVLHARRLETLWLIASDPGSRGNERTMAVLSACAAALRAPLRFRGFLTRIDGDKLTVVAVTPDGDDNGEHVRLYPVGGRLAIESSSALNEARTQFWGSDNSMGLPAAALALGWRSEITTRFEAAGSRYVLTFGSAATTDFDPDDAAFIEVLADAFAHQLAYDSFEQTLRGAEERARSHAERLEALWRVANDSSLRGEPLWVAMLSEAAASIRPGQAFEGIFSCIDGDNVIRLAAVTASGKSGRRELVVPLSVPLSQTFLSAIVAQGGGTHAWDDITQSEVTSQVAHARGWRAVIGATFPAAGKTYALGFGSSDPMREPFRPFEYAYIDVLAAFFARNVQDAWIAANHG